METKTCTRCGVTKGLSDFHKAKGGRLGRRADCAACNRARQRLSSSDKQRAAKWRAVMPTWRRSARVRVCPACRQMRPHEDFARAKATKDGRYAYCRACVSASSRERHLKSPERGRKRSRAWRDANPERARSTGAAWRARNPEKHKAKGAKWVRENPGKNRLKQHRRRARIAAATIVPFTHDELMASWEDDGLYACVFCDGPFDEIEHILPLSRGGEHSIANLVPSCVDCNRGVGGKGSRLPWEWLSERYPELAPILVPSVLPDVDPAP